MNAAKFAEKVAAFVTHPSQFDTNRGSCSPAHLPADMAVDWWFPTEGRVADAKAAAAIEICHGCPVRLECLDDAVSRNEQHGIWGGRRFDTPRVRHRDVR